MWPATGLKRPLLFVWFCFFCIVECLVNFICMNNTNYSLRGSYDNQMIIVQLSFKESSDTFDQFSALELAKTVGCAIILYRLGYCNSTLASTSKHNIDSLQIVQNQ